MSNRIAFVPWDRNVGVEYIAKIDDWNNSAGDTHHGHTYTAVFAGDGGNPLESIKMGTRIYVKGHGMPGDHEIYPTTTAPTGLRYDAVADRLIAAGLKKLWPGVIVCDNCYSGCPRLGSQAFAAKLSQNLRGRGYLMISFIGLFGPIDSYYNDKGGKYMHRYVTAFEDTRFQKEIKSKFMQMRF
jgi:hypothetical protein